MKILAVDDDRSIRELMPMALAEAGYSDVAVAGSAQEAMGLIRSQSAAAPFECLLLDIQMPGTNGIELCREIRRLPGYGSAPIIMLTAMQDRSFIDKAFAAGATDYVIKPFVITELHARIRAAKVGIEARAGGIAPAATDTSDADHSGTGSLFELPLDLGSMNGLVNSNTFGNYLGQLARAGYRSSTFFAVHLLHGNALFARCTPSEFRRVLGRIADSVVASQMSGEMIACYVGSGNFVCVTSTANARPAAEIEATIQGALDEQNLFFEDGSPVDIEVAVGASFQPPFSDALPADAIEAQTIQRAMTRARDKTGQPRPVTIRRVGGK